MDIIILIILFSVCPQDHSQLSEEGKKTELEKEKARLENSLHCIAQAVINDIDKEDDIAVQVDVGQVMVQSNDEQEQIPASVTPLKNIRSYLMSSTPNLDRSDLRYAKHLIE